MSILLLKETTGFEHWWCSLGKILCLLKKKNVLVKIKSLKAVLFNLTGLSFVSSPLHLIKKDFS